MSQRRTWAAGAALVTVLLIIASYFLLIGPKRSDASALRAQTVSQEQTNSQLQLDIAQLKAQFATLPAKQAELAVIRQQMPGSPNLPTIVRNLSTIASESGVVLSSISPASPAAVTGGGGTAASTTAGLLQIPLTIAIQGDYASTELFLQKMQTQMRRVFLVQSLAMAPTTGKATDGTTLPKGAIAVTLSGDVFVLQATTTTTTGTAAGQAAPSTTTPATGSAN